MTTQSEVEGKEGWEETARDLRTKATHKVNLKDIVEGFHDITIDEGVAADISFDAHDVKLGL